MSNEQLHPSTALADIFTSYEQERIPLFRRFLTGVLSPDVARRAGLVGYSSKEHDQAWKDLDVIDGRDLTFEDAFQVSQRALLSDASPALKGRLRFLDQVENLWFERYRQAIVRFIGPDELEAFQLAFWQDLKQEPEGPGVLGSLTKLCDRHEALNQNSTPGAQQLYEAMDRRGFNAALIADVRQRIDQCRHDMPEAPAPLPNAAKLVQAADDRKAAYRRLNAFYNDWAATLRGELTYHQAVRLGITEVKGGRSDNAPAEPASPVPPVPPQP